MMSDDKLQLTASDHNADAGDDVAGMPSYRVDETENIGLPSASPTLRPLVDYYYYGPVAPATSSAAHPDLGACPPYDAQQPGPVHCHVTESRDQRHQHQQPSVFLRHSPQSTSTDEQEDTSKRMSCTPGQWAAIGVCIFIKIFIILLAIFIRYNYYN